MASQRSNGAARAKRGAGTAPTYPPPPPCGLSPVLERNIRALQLRRQREEKDATVEERIAEAITRFTGSMRFVYLHLAFFGFWIVANLGWVPGVPAWDPSFVVLAMVASVEAIFLSTFVLISQNRMAAAADKRADLDLQISLLAEHEVTRLVTLVSGIAERMGVKTDADADLKEITLDVAPEASARRARGDGTGSRAALSSGPPYGTGGSARRRSRASRCEPGATCRPGVLLLPDAASRAVPP
jgi:uncharacterized membrane protein